MMNTPKPNSESHEPLDPQLIDYVFDQLDDDQQRELEVRLASDAGARHEVAQWQRLAQLLRDSTAHDSTAHDSMADNSTVNGSRRVSSNSRLRKCIEQHLSGGQQPLSGGRSTSTRRRIGLVVALSLSILLLVGLGLYWRMENRPAIASLFVARSDDSSKEVDEGSAGTIRWDDRTSDGNRLLRQSEPFDNASLTERRSAGESSPEAVDNLSVVLDATQSTDFSSLANDMDGDVQRLKQASGSRRSAGRTEESVVPRDVAPRDVAPLDVAPIDAVPPGVVPLGADEELSRLPEVTIRKLTVSATPDHGVKRNTSNQDVRFLVDSSENEDSSGRSLDLRKLRFTDELSSGPASRESYQAITENEFVRPTGEAALSTFSIDVDTASYSNIRRFLRNGQLPPHDAVRVEECINYFRYAYGPPNRGEAFSASMYLADCPWHHGHQLLRIGIKGRELPQQERPPSNLVFLIDVSGSMADDNKLPLLRESLNLLVSQLDERDRVTIVTYAGEASLRLPPTSGEEKSEIRRVIDSLKPSGSTHGSAGIKLAYQKATESYLSEGTNRVLLATDGDLNVGIQDNDALVQLIKEQAATGVMLSVLGFGTGNLKDAKLEMLADNGNGIYAYIDTLREGKRVLVEQMTGSLVTIAKDVKIQIEFNPAEVAAYRLIGYENRQLAHQDFDNDQKDAGEIGAGHTVTAFYELVPADGSRKDKQRAATSRLKYQQARPQVPPSTDALTAASDSGELLTLWIRYKQPDSEISKRLEFTLNNSSSSFAQAPIDFQFASAVASFGLLLRESKHRGSATWVFVEEIASSAVGNDPDGYRAEFVDLVRRAATLSP